MLEMGGKHRAKSKTKTEEPEKKKETRGSVIQVLVVSTSQDPRLI